MMKSLNKLILASAISCIAGSTWAADVPPTGSDLGHGTLHITGSVINAPCSIAPGDESIDVPLGQVANKVLESGAGYSLTQPITIHLQNCDLTAQTVPGTGGNNTAYPAFSKVAVKFTGAADATNTELYANSGTAQGVGIRLIDTMAGSAKLNANSSSAEVGLTPGDNVLQFGARLERIGASTPVATGTVAADVTYAMDYK
ncbi:MULTISPECIES: fimbrial protein [Enterobacteriaceae]|uniref:fimbrial protein n=1 Tax=Enterobacteriaceae TaxID=543 RepID=UPI001258AEEC|nr:fimbrial protein [Enterobacter hormaechei]EEP0988719.1 fimbrial protein [Salmonella enterica]EEP1049016.1 fimbrial protein [Salmonella enterica]EEP1113489.1 fimbrial protein [Salmonella enterica]VAE62606.1 fimbrial protein domain-containing protein [Enterobacter hormaechei]